MTSDIVSGINWARTHGAKVISMSLGGGGTSTLQTAVANAYYAGLIVVATAFLGLGLWPLVCSVVAAALMSVVYSYVIYKRLEGLPARPSA